MNDATKKRLYVYSCALGLAFSLLGCGGSNVDSSKNSPQLGVTPPPAGAAALAQKGVGKVSGSISGLNHAPATVILGNDSTLLTAVADSNGKFEFNNVAPGTYFIKAEADDFVISQSQQVVIGQQTATTLPSKSDAATIAIDNVIFLAQARSSNTFSYHWTGDASVSGYEATAYVNKPAKIVFLDQTISPPDSAASLRLLHDYNIILSNEQVTWNQEYASRLLNTMDSIPQQRRNSYSDLALKPSKWVLNDKFISDDIAVQRSSAGDTVTLSAATFTYATPKLVSLDGVKGSFFSQRLHHALVRYVSKDGSDINAIEKILNDRYGCTSLIPDYAKLTRNTTVEDSGRFTKFRPEELVSMINMFEEMPDGFHSVKGLKYVVRRNYGQSHPKYSSAPAVAWPTAQAESYIEFMDTAFSDTYSSHRLIIHEKTHFMWENLFNEGLRDDWATVGGWYRSPSSSSGWATTQTTQFVSAYAHNVNPNEDMAESMADFILNPALLESRAPLKYQFIRDRIMHGDRYVSVIRPDLTFQVLNLYPDYSYPGKIQRLDLNVVGAPQEDKLVNLEIEVSATDPRFPGAKYAYLRIFSEIGTFVDVYLQPKNNAGTILGGTFNISKVSKKGYWLPDQITLTDQVGNQRSESVKDFGWKMYIDNPQEVTANPGYVPHSLTTQLLPAENKNGHSVQKMQVQWQIQGNQSLSDYIVYARMANIQTGNYYEAYGTYDPVRRRATILFELSEYIPSGAYGVTQISMRDEANNWTTQKFSNSPLDEPMTMIQLVSINGDTAAPELDLNRITVTASPTRPNAPDGETLVTIVYYVRDDKSGLGTVSYQLLDPQGIIHADYHYHSNFYTQFFEGDPTAWTRYELKVLLPVGSVPGTWGLKQIGLYDKASNRHDYGFVETLHFNVITN